MPRMTAPQLFWTGVGVLTLGFLIGWAGAVFVITHLFDDSFDSTWVHSGSTALSGALTVVGAAMIGSGLVVGALQRSMSATAESGPRYGPPQAMPPAGPGGQGASTAQVPVAGPAA